MKMKLNVIAIVTIALILQSCDTTKKAAQVEEIEERQLSPVVVTASKPDADDPETYELDKYNPSHTRKHDLIHTKLELRFDWANQHVLGTATLDLMPYFYETDKLVLDAKGFDIHSISNAKTGKSLKYNYDEEQLFISLDKVYKKGEKYQLSIKYTAKPNERKIGGSEAITSDKGLYFINPKNEQPGVPQQIWTQGETESNSAWFPTIDKPNERCTQEMYVTVQDRFKTLSNGLLLSSNKNSDGTRTDYWKMDLPHAPYLFMLGIGEFAVVEEKWGDMLLQYYVEPDYEASAKNIYSNTPEMLTFFSDQLGVKYPWQKYSQVVVREYVSGAMENTTGVIFGDFVQKTNRELIDNHNERIVAHELFHHWFGDLVTCESWANLTMNEGFANYSEYLWFEHKYGRDEADYHLLTEHGGYIQSSRNNMHDLIYFGYADKEDMFDAHSYNKGGAILHMLKNYVGAEAFWASLKLYLEENEYTAVEAHNLRLAFEEVVGEDMNWFFNQWYFDKGHPVVEVSYDYSQAGKASVTIKQTQDPKLNPPIFILPIDIDVYTDSGKKRERVWMNEREQTFTFDIDGAAKLISVDADRVLLWEKTDVKTDEQYVYQFLNTGKFQDQYDALEALAAKNNAASKTVVESALSNDFWVIRSMGVSSVNPQNNPGVIAQLVKMADKDPHSQVKAACLQILGDMGDKTNASIVKKAALSKTEAYPVVSAGLVALSSLDLDEAYKVAGQLESETNANLLSGVSEIYVAKKAVEKMDFFEKNLTNMQGYPAITFFDNYRKLYTTLDRTGILSKVALLKGIGTDMAQNPYRRLAAIKTIFDTKAKFVEDTEAKQIVSKAIADIKAAETNGQLKAIYDQNF